MVNGQWVTQDNSYDAFGRRYATTVTNGSGTTPISYAYDGRNTLLGYNASASPGSLLGLGLDESVPGEFQWRLAEFGAQRCLRFCRRSHQFQPGRD